MNVQQAGIEYSWVMGWPMPLDNHICKQQPCIACGHYIYCMETLVTYIKVLVFKWCPDGYQGAINGSNHLWKASYLIKPSHGVLEYSNDEKRITRFTAPALHHKVRTKKLNSYHNSASTRKTSTLCGPPRKQHITVEKVDCFFLDWQLLTKVFYSSLEVCSSVYRTLTNIK